MSKSVKLIFTVMILLIFVSNVSAISKTINVDIVETRNISLFFTQLNNLDNEARSNQNSINFGGCFL